MGFSLSLQGLKNEVLWPEAEDSIHFTPRNGCLGEAGVGVGPPP